MEKTYIVTVKKIADCGDAAPITHDTLGDKVYRSLMRFVYICYASVFLLPLFGLHPLGDIVALWMACFSLLTAAAYSGNRLSALIHNKCPDAPSHTLVLLFSALLSAGFLFYCPYQPFQTTIRTKGADALAWLSTIYFLHLRIKEQRLGNPADT